MVPGADIGQCKSGSAQFLSSKSGERGAERWRQHRVLVWAALAHVLRSLLRLLMNVLQTLIQNMDPYEMLAL